MCCPVPGQWRQTAQRDMVAWHGTLTWYSTVSWHGTVAVRGIVPWHGAVSWHSAVSWHGAVAWHGGVTWHSSETYCVVVSWHGSDPALCGHQGWGRELAHRGELLWQSQLAQRDGRARCKANICVCARMCHVWAARAPMCGHAGCRWLCLPLAVHRGVAHSWDGTASLSPRCPKAHVCAGGPCGGGPGEHVWLRPQAWVCASMHAGVCTVIPTHVQP